MKEYKNILGTTEKNKDRYSDDLPYNIPIYKRKPYEMRSLDRELKITSIIGKGTASTESYKYYPYEMEDTRLYQFDKITDCV